jgi:hypothetical protein
MLGFQWEEEPGEEEPVPKSLTLAALVIFWTGMAAAGDLTLSRVVDLDKPGALEALQPGSTYPFFVRRARVLRGATCGGSSPGVVEWALRI